MAQFSFEQPIQAGRATSCWLFGVGLVHGDLLVSLRLEEEEEKQGPAWLFYPKYHQLLPTAPPCPCKAAFLALASLSLSGFEVAEDLLSSAVS